MNIHKNVYQSKALIMDIAHQSEFNLDTSKAEQNHKFHWWLCKISTINFMRRKPKEGWHTKAAVDFFVSKVEKKFESSELQNRRATFAM